MGLHHLTWRVTASGLEDEEIIAEAISVLIGDEELVDIERTSSYHGSHIHLISASTKRNKVAVNSLANLGSECLDELIDTLDARLDESNTIHFRLSLDELMAGNVKIVESNVKSIKGYTKLEVYPGQSAKEEANKILNSAKNISKF
jgi:RNA binding exosome subunit